MNTCPPITQTLLPKLLVLAFSIGANITLAQAPDSVINHKIDSIQQRVNNIANPNIDLDRLTLKAPRLEFKKPDSLKAVHELDSMKRGLTTKIDSLQRLNLPTDRYTRKLDSINQIGPQKYIELANSKARSVQDEINRLGKDAGLKNSELNLTKDLNKDLNLETPDLNKDLGLNTDLNTDIKNPITTDLKNPISTDIKDPIDKLKSIDQLETAREKLGDANQVTDKIQSYQGDVKNIAEGKVGEVKELPKTIENKAAQLNEVKELQKQTGEIDKAKEMVKGKDPEAMKTVAKQQVTKQAVDHFKGKEQVLQQAMDKVSKLKEKYPDVSSLKDLPKRVPNPMKRKPLIERVVPGVTLQIQKSNHFMIDVNPVVSYRFTGRINAGLGWNERFVFMKWNKLSGYDRIYGPRVFGSFGFKKGFAAKAEIEKMNTLVPSSTLSGDGSRQWVWSCFVGLKKDYRFIGKVKGNVQLLYNIYDDHDNSPYLDRINVRMGFEFPMKKPKKPENQGKK